MSGGGGKILEGFPLTEKEHKGIQITDEMIQELKVKESRCLVG
jgi:hypothetical protein